MTKNNYTQNKDKVQKHLKKIVNSGLGNYIDGEWQKIKTSFTNTTPIDNSFICEVNRSDRDEVNHACVAAKKAFSGWKNRDVKQRKAILYRVAELIEQRAEEIALLESYDSGQPYKFMSKAIARGADNFRYFADKIVELRNGISLMQEQHTNFTVRNAIGPIAVITPWNTPFMLSTWKVAPALAAGCTVVHKPAELSPVTASILADIFEKAGLPAGVYNLLQGLGSEAGRQVTEHPDIAGVSFVGESSTGSAIMRQGADSLKRVHFELGGKNPVVVFEDADLDRALDAVVMMIFSLNGQRCTSSSRLIIHKDIREKFVQKLCRRAEAIVVGNPLDPAVEIGPLISSGHLQKVSSYFESAPKEGARIATGGRIVTDLQPGFYVTPTVIEGVTTDMAVSREEIFGPVLSVLEFETEQQAVEIANATEYGLAGYIWSKDGSRCMRMAHALDVGMLWINSENNRNLSTPFGGCKRSGIGRDGGDFSFEFYMEQKNICLAHGDHHIMQMGKI